MARRVRRLFRGGRVIDLGAGHGLLAQLMLLLDDSSPTALAVDKTLPASSATLHNALAQTWPRLGRVAFVACPLDDEGAVDPVRPADAADGDEVGLRHSASLEKASVASAGEPDGHSPGHSP